MRLTIAAPATAIESAIGKWLSPACWVQRLRPRNASSQRAKPFASPSCRSNVGYGTIRIEGWFVAARRVRMRGDELRVELDAEPRSGGQQRPALVDRQPMPLYFLA